MPGAGSRRSPLQESASFSLVVLRAFGVAKHHLHLRQFALRIRVLRFGLHPRLKHGLHLGEWIVRHEHSRLLSREVFGYELRPAEFVLKLLVGDEVVGVGELAV